MKIVIIGSGNVAYHLAKAFTESGIHISQIFGRNEEKLQNISRELGVKHSITELYKADVYLLCVSDDAITEVSQLITNPNALVAHTSGSMPKEILVGNYRKSSFYPMQTFSRNKKLNYAEIPFFIETENEEDTKILLNLANKISDNVMITNYEQRKYIHLTAVFSCNFVNHLFARAKEIADSQGIPFHFFHPLIKETLEKIYVLDPKLAQTGPAFRNDKRVLQLHESLITNDLQKEIYKVMNASIQEMYGLE